ncbi:MAG: EamA family transporter [Planctomycetota bacterium]|nr:MAG: EamA family transporter [Planctomycetota bacterium]
MRPGLRTGALTAATMIAFAANSLLCRAALQHDAIGPARFTAIRILAGALALAPLAWTRSSPARRHGTWPAAIALFAYALFFSLAYVRLQAGTGALLLFGTVQAAMIAWGLRGGERPGPVTWLGLAGALGGLAWLLLPGISAPHPFGAALMIGAGLSWSAYSIFGRGAADPIAATAGNFLRAVPLAAAALFALGLRETMTARGLALAAISGALTSGLGYVLWYAALRSLPVTSAAIVQLAVPVVAAAGGVLLLGERPGLRLVLAGSLVLAGVAAAILGRTRRPP